MAQWGNTAAPCSGSQWDFRRVASPEERPGHTTSGISGTTNHVSLEFMEQSKARGQQSAIQGSKVIVGQRMSSLTWGRWFSSHHPWESIPQGEHSGDTSSTLTSLSTTGEASPALAMPTAPSIPLLWCSLQLPSVSQEGWCRFGGPGAKSPRKCPRGQRSGSSAGENKAICHPSTAINTARPKIHTHGDTQQHRPTQAPLPCHPRHSQGGDCYNINTTMFQTTPAQPTKLEATTVETKLVQRSTPWWS